MTKDGRGKERIDTLTSTYLLGVLTALLLMSKAFLVGAASVGNVASGAVPMGQ